MNYLEYHIKSAEILDIDPSYYLMEYLCDRYVFNLEERLWLAFLYSTCYNSATAFYMKNEFPDLSTVDMGRINRWWSEHKNQCIFTTDRLRVKTQNQFPLIIQSYLKLVEKYGSQENIIAKHKGDTPEQTYINLYNMFNKDLYYYGRFSLFLLLESFWRLSKLDSILPDTLNLKDAESCRNGVAFAIGREDLNTHDDTVKLTEEDHSYLQDQFKKLVSDIKEMRPDDNIYNIETTLCAYKKFQYGKRYIGYYLDRLAREILQMQENVNEGVCWDPLIDHYYENIPNGRKLMDELIEARMWEKQGFSKKKAKTMNSKMVLF